jgi:hypothetical protein
LKIHQGGPKTGFGSELTPDLQELRSVSVWQEEEAAKRFSETKNHGQRRSWLSGRI